MSFNDKITQFIIIIIMMQAVYECIDKITQFVSKAAIFSFLPMLTWV